MSGKRRTSFKAWSFYYFDEVQIDALDEWRLDETRKGASKSAGDYEHMLCRVIVEEVANHRAGGKGRGSK